MSETKYSKKEIKEFIKNNSLKEATQKFGNKAVMFALIPARTSNTKLQHPLGRYDPNKPRVKLKKGPYKINPNKPRVKLRPASSKIVDLRTTGRFK